MINNSNQPDTAMVEQLRIAEAARLSMLMNLNKGFSYLRLSDGESQWILAVQRGEPTPWYQYFSNNQASPDLAIGTRGLEQRHYNRFIQSYEKCTYLDYCENFSEANRINLSKISLNRNPEFLKNPSEEASNIIYSWAFYEMSRYLENHSCIFASAEGAISRELFMEPQYRALAQRYYPNNSAIHFVQIRNDGRNYSENLDLIKDDLLKSIKLYSADTIFISLAFGSKILCYELANEMKIRAIDWGSLSRGLIYCGSPGYHSARSDHTPYFLRVPFNLYIDALCRAHPNMSNSTIISKAYAQLILELQRKKYLSSSPADVHSGGFLDLSESNTKAFKAGLRFYKKKFGSVIKNDPEAKEQDSKFSYWRLKHGLGISGKIFVFLVFVKGCFRAVIKCLGSAKKVPS